MGAPGGEGTFYAATIYAAQASLVANARPNTKNVIVILSDGDATATTTEGLKSPTPAPTWAYTATNECTQAVTAAQAAAMASGTNANGVTYEGTTIYTVAYGAEATGCTGDTITPSPCDTMENMALNAGSTTPYAQNFFSDYTATGSSGTCISNARPTSNLNQIFQEISYDLTAARLIPNNTM